MSAELDWDESTRLVDLLLEEQQTLTAVDEFAAYHERAEHDASRYESLIPSGPAGAGQQYAFRVDLDACTGCKACVTACHSLNGLEDEEVWREVGLVASDVGIPPVASPPTHVLHQQTVTAACHHCEEPGCLAGCPVQAYEKDPETGIVRHLDDQCIGCRYCQLMCPYDVPTYSERLGIVRKCDMCHERLSEGEAPACVQGCPNEAISIAIVETGGEADLAARMLPVSPGTMPESSWTRPTTRYVSARAASERVDPIDLSAVEPAEGHTPLAAMLVLTQVAIGSIAIESLLSMGGVLPGAGSPSSLIVSTMATLIGLAGLCSSFLHIGRPQWAFRAILGLRTSWLSREIVVLGAFGGLLVGACLSSWIAWAVTSEILDGAWSLAAGLQPLVMGMAVSIGLLGLFCSIQIYAVTGRPLWRIDRTAIRFGMTAAWAGVAAVQLGLAVTAETTAFSPHATQVALAVVLVGLTGLRLRMESGRLVESHDPLEAVALVRTRQLLGEALLREAKARRGLFLLAGIYLPVALITCALAGASSWLQGALAALILSLGIASDLVERSLFFRSEAMPSMPGVG